MITDYIMNIWKDTYANLTADNQVIPAGSPVYETDTGRMKIGTGAQYNSTAYTIGKTTKDLDNDISSADVTITLDADAPIGDKYIITWINGDDSHQLVVNPAGSDTLNFADQELDSTAQARFGEGTGNAVIEKVSATEWQITKYLDSDGGAFTNKWQKTIDGIGQIWADLTETLAVDTSSSVWGGYYDDGSANSYDIAPKSGSQPKIYPTAKEGPVGVGIDDDTPTATNYTLRYRAIDSVASRSIPVTIYIVLEWY